MVSDMSLSCNLCCAATMTCSRARAANSPESLALTKMSADDTVPGWPVSLIELLFNAFCYVFFYNEPLRTLHVHRMRANFTRRDFGCSTLTHCYRTSHSSVHCALRIIRWKAYFTSEHTTNTG